MRKARKVGTKRGPYKRKSKLPAPEAPPYPGLYTQLLKLNSYLIFPCRVYSQRRRFMVCPVGSGKRCSPWTSGADAAPVSPTGGILAISLLSSSTTRLPPTSRWSRQWRRATAPSACLLSNSPRVPHYGYLSSPSRGVRTHLCPRPAWPGASPTPHRANC